MAILDFTGDYHEPKTKTIDLSTPGAKTGTVQIYDQDDKFLGYVVLNIDNPLAVKISCANAVVQHMERQIYALYQAIDEEHNPLKAAWTAFKLKRLEHKLAPRIDYHSSIIARCRSHFLVHFQ